MSRTYRRLRGDQTRGPTLRSVSHCGDFSCKRCERDFTMALVHFTMDGRRSMGQTPSWHWHETTTVPARREERDLCKKILRLKDLEDAPLFPTRKRPKEWYW